MRFSSIRLICAVVGSLVIFFTSFACLALDVNYSDSAHGNSILDPSLSSVYAKGNCAHCHEQHTANSEGYLLFMNNYSNKEVGPYFEADALCFGCHGGNIQAVTNYDYSKTFGGSNLTPGIDSILDAFNQKSNHNLNDIKTFIIGTSRPPGFYEFSAKSSPCSACHNPHLAKSNNTFPINLSNSAISRPLSHDDLWGDDPGEKMPSIGSEYYQPPNRTGGGLEPDGGSDRAIQAAKTPDYDSLCIDCHNDSNSISSYTLGTLKTFDWSLEQHGWGNAIDETRPQMKLPYLDSNMGEYVVSCLDCHEPHGSPNIYLIRSSVNSGEVSLAEVVGADRTYIPWDNLCARCHKSADDLRGLHHTYNTEFNCIDCHYHNNNQGQAINNSDPKVRACTTCHYHGSSATSSTSTYKTF